jgi:hypothetical protein
LNHFHRSVTEVVDGGEGVPLVNEVLPGSAEVGPDVKGEKLEAALGGGLEDRQLKYLPVQVHRNVAPQLLGELFQYLKHKTLQQARSAQKVSSPEYRTLFNREWSGLRSDHQSTLITRISMTVFSTKYNT